MKIYIPYMFRCSSFHHLSKFTYIWILLLVFCSSVLYFSLLCSHEVKMYIKREDLGENTVCGCLSAFYGLRANEQHAFWDDAKNVSL